MSPQEWLAIGLLLGFFALLMTGVPVGITLAASGFIFGFLGFGETLFALLPARIYGVVANYQWLAIPLFVFMGVMLEKSRLAEDLLDVIGHLAGGMRGGMALGIIGVGVLMGATTGIVGATRGRGRPRALPRGTAARLRASAAADAANAADARRARHGLRLNRWPGWVTGNQRTSGTASIRLNVNAPGSMRVRRKPADVSSLRNSPSLRSCDPSPSSIVTINAR